MGKIELEFIITNVMYKNHLSNDWDYFKNNGKEIIITAKSMNGIINKLRYKISKNLQIGINIDIICEMECHLNPIELKYKYKNEEFIRIKYDEDFDCFDFLDDFRIREFLKENKIKNIEDIGVTSKYYFDFIVLKNNIIKEQNKSIGFYLVNKYGSKNVTDLIDKDNFEILYLNNINYYYNDNEGVWENYEGDEYIIKK